KPSIICPSDVELEVRKPEIEDRPNPIKTGESQHQVAGAREPAARTVHQPQRAVRRHREAAQHREHAERIEQRHPRAEPAVEQEELVHGDGGDEPDPACDDQHIEERAQSRPEPETRLAGTHLELSAKAAAHDPAAEPQDERKRADRDGAEAEEFEQAELLESVDALQLLDGEEIVALEKVDAAVILDELQMRLPADLAIEKRP